METLLESHRHRPDSRARTRGLTLKAADRPTLEGWARSQTWPHRQVQRARIRRALAAGQTLAAVGTEVGVTEDTVATWRDRYLAAGRDGWHDRPRRGGPPTYTEADRQARWQKLREAPPDGHTRGSLSLMARATGIATGHRQRGWAEAGLQPHRVRTFQLSNDPQCEAKRRAVIAV